MNRNITIEDIENYFEEVAGSWNGDNPGIQEDLAHISNDILELIKEFKTA